MSGLRILVCVKRVPAPGARIVLTADGLGIDTRNLGFTTSPHEECAVEEALQLVERHGGEVTVLTVGPPDAEEQLRYALSLGVTRAVHVRHPSLDGVADWDARSTAGAITHAIASLESGDGPFDLILFGNESADASGYQVGVRVARAIGRPMVNGIKAISVQSGRIEASRERGDGFEVYRLDLPAVLGVKEGINLPRYPTVQGRLRSKKATVTTVEAAGPVAAGVRVLGFETPPEVVVHTEVLGTGAAAAPAVVDLLERLGLL